MYKELDSLHEKILNSKFAEEVTEQEILALVEAKEIRAKAIDEFAEQLKEQVSSHFRYRGIIEEVDEYADYIDEIAEKMKAGGKNEND